MTNRSKPARYSARVVTSSLPTPEAILDALPNPVAVLDAAGVITMVNRSWRRFDRSGALAGLGFAIGADYIQLCRAMLSEDRSLADRIDRGLQAVLASQSEQFTQEYRAGSSDGEGWFRLTATPLAGQGAPGAVVTHLEITDRKRMEEAQDGYIATIAQDIGELKRAEAALLEERNLLRTLIDTLPDVVYVKDAEHRIVIANVAAAQINHMAAPDDLIGKTDFDLYPPELAASFAAAEQQIMRSGRPQIENQDSTGDQDGGRRWFLNSKIPVQNQNGQTLGLVGIGRDITERVRAEEALKESETRFRQLAEHIRAVFWLTDPATSQILYVSPAYEEIWGRSCQSLYDDPNSFLAAIHPADRRRVEQSSARHGFVGAEEEYRIVRPDGRVVWIHDHGFAIRRDDGTIYRVAGIATDITERKRLEEQLLQAQKMEGIGRLAGGIAHDFNNLLTAIVGYAEFIEGSLLSHDPRHADVEQILKAATRATGLTRQLLTFARKQVIAPQVINLNDLVLSTMKLLRPLIGEDIDMAALLAPDLGLVKADPSQFEQILMNLAVNARDAMPLGGKLTIETQNIFLDAEYARHHTDVVPGPHVLLAVSDVGIGMSETTQAHIFEPFYTTKEPGKGTGLGLAVCHGIVSQAGGHIWVYSELGVGTTFKIFLPQVMSQAALAASAAADAPTRGGSETLLLVEDEPLVRELAVQALRGHGYRVLVAKNGNEALAIVSEHAAALDLLITDVVLPQMSGRQLAGQLGAVLPGLKVLYVSGYAEHTIVHHGVLDEGVAFLPKPFTPGVLVRKVREVLDDARKQV